MARIETNSKESAWAMVDEIFPTDYIEDSLRTSGSGYPVYKSTVNDMDYICDLGDRLEVNLHTGKTVNVWITKEKKEEEIQMKKMDDLKVYECIIDDGVQVFKTDIPAVSKQALLRDWGGNGEFVRIKDVTFDRVAINGHDNMVDRIQSALRGAGFDEGMIRLMYMLYEKHYDNVINSYC